MSVLFYYSVADSTPRELTAPSIPPTRNFVELVFPLTKQGRPVSWAGHQIKDHRWPQRPNLCSCLFILIPKINGVDHDFFWKTYADFTCLTKTVSQQLSSSCAPPTPTPSGTQTLFVSFHLSHPTPFERPSSSIHPFNPDTLLLRKVDFQQPTNETLPPFWPLTTQCVVHI